MSDLRNKMIEIISSIELQKYKDSLNHLDVENAADEIIKNLPKAEATPSASSLFGEVTNRRKSN